VGRNADKGHVALRGENFSTKAATSTVPAFIAGWTVSDLADFLAPIAPDQPNTVQRIRHWTREGILLPIESSAHAGPGVHRLYGDAAIYCAAFLHVYTVAGLPISHSRFLKKIMPMVDTAAAQWHGARQKKQTAKLESLVLGVSAAGTIRINAPKSDVRDAVLTLAFDLSKLFAEVDRGRP
jgi:DNA-binding transcriptional MerR regulator